MSQRIPPDDFERHRPRSSLYVVTHHLGHFLDDHLRAAPCRRMLPPGFHLINRRDQEDFGEREAVHRILCDLEHKSHPARCTLHAKPGGLKCACPLRDLQDVGPASARRQSVPEYGQSTQHTHVFMLLLKTDLHRQPLASNVRLPHQH